MGKGKPKSKGTKLQLGEFLGDNAGNTVNIGGKTVEMPSAPKAATLEIDITKVRTVVLFSKYPLVAIIVVNTIVIWISYRYNLGSKNPHYCDTSVPKQNLL